MRDAAWIAADWGGSNLRLWRMAGTRQIDTAASEAGAGTLDRDGVEPALTALAAPWLGKTPMPVVACGMVGARQGWVEAPYATVPCAPLGGASVRAPAADPRLAPWAVSAAA